MATVRLEIVMRALRTILISFALLIICSVAAYAQSAPVHYLSLATNNATLVKTGRTRIKILLPINTTSTVYYLHLYNLAVAPTCGTSAVAWTVPVPQATGAGAGAVIPIPDGLQFPLGLGFCLTGGIADNDNTSAAAGVVINFGLAGY
jgi:hypothetical protein